MKISLNLAVLTALETFLTCCGMLKDSSSEDKSNPSKIKGKKPNIVVIFADDLGFGDIESFGAKGSSTPNIDSIGRDGFTNRDFFMPVNVCSPARTALLTGRYPMRNVETP